MSKTHSIAVFLLLCVIGTVIGSTQDVYVSGEYLLAITDDDELTHISSLGSFDPDTGVWEDKFGGVYQTIFTHPFNQIEYTNSGLFATGDFTFVGPKNIYSPSVLLYTEAENGTASFEGVGNGIWLGSIDAPEVINWVVGVGETTLFAGFFHAVEDISLAAGEPVEVPSIVQWTSDHKWELLPNDNHVFPEDAYIGGVATSPDGVSDIAFIYTTNPTAVFTWSSELGYSDVSPSGFEGFNAGNFVVDSLGNPAGLSKVETTGNVEYSLVYLDANNNFANKTYSIISYPEIPAFPPVLLPYLDGILISVSQAADKTVFHFFNSTSQEYFTKFVVPSVTTEIRDTHHLVAGLNGELWLGLIDYSDYIYRYTSTTPVWNKVPLASLPSASNLTVVSLTYDWNKKTLVGYGVDLEGSHGIWFSIESGKGPQEKSPGYVSTEGKITSSVVVEDSDGDGFTLWIGGFFSSVGSEGAAARNVAAWKDGEWVDLGGKGTFPVAAMALYQGHTMFFAWDTCVENSEALTLGWYPVDTDNIMPNPFEGSFPLLIGGDGCVATIVAYKDEIFIGGNFSVSLPPYVGATANGVVHYNLTSKEWKGIDIPATIQSTGDVYKILSMVVAPGIGTDGADVLFIGGHFEFTSTNNHNYAGFAAYSLAEGGGWLNVKTFTPDTVVHEIIPGTGSKLFIGGSLQLNSSAPEEGVVEYDFSTNTFIEVGELSNIANSILLMTVNGEDDDESNDEITVYAGGNLQNAEKDEYPVASYDFTAQLAGTKSNWTKTGSNIFQNYFLGQVFYLVYETGGSGEGGANGNASDPDGSGISGWWITVIVLVCLGAVVLLIAAGVAGAWYYKKKTSYQQID